MYSLLATILSIPTTFAALGGNTIPTTQNTPVTSVPFTGPFSGETIETVLGRLASYAVIVGSSVATIMVLYGAFQLLTSRGNATQITSGKKTITYAIGGLVIVVLAKGLVSLFALLARNLGI